MAMSMTLQKHPKAAPFRNKGWPPYEEFRQLLPTSAKGSNAFHPTQAEMHEGSDGDPGTPQADGDEKEPGGGDGETGDERQDLDANEGGRVSTQAGDEEADNNERPRDAGCEESAPLVAANPGPRPHAPLEHLTKLKYSALQTVTPTPSSSRSSTTSGMRASPNPFTPLSSSGGKGIRVRQTLTAAAIAQVAETIADIGTSIGNSRTGTESSPVRKRKAMDLTQELEDDLSDNDLSSLLELFETNVMAADAYVTIKREGLRKTWVQRKLAKLV